MARACGKGLWLLVPPSPEVQPLSPSSEALLLWAWASDSLRCILGYRSDGATLGKWSHQTGAS
jgi:hypothetical protein